MDLSQLELLLRLLESHRLTPRHIKAGDFEVFVDPADGPAPAQTSSRVGFPSQPERDELGKFFSSKGIEVSE